jgi:hypothetical protein
VKVTTIEFKEESPTVQDLIVGQQRDMTFNKICEDFQYKNLCDFSPQENYTDRATAACRRVLVPNLRIKVAA